MKRKRAKIISTIHFGSFDLPDFDVEKVGSLTWRHAFSGHKIHAVICAIPTGLDFAKIFVLKAVSPGRARIAVFDLILRRPENLRDKLHALVKRLTLKSVDLFLMIQRDWSGYVRPAGISVYLQAMALGKPVVITRGSSTEGILNETLALLVPAEDPEAMRAALETLWNDAGLRARMGASGRKFAIALQGDERLAADIGRHLHELCIRR